MKKHIFYLFLLIPQLVFAFDYSTYRETTLDEVFKSSKEITEKHRKSKGLEVVMDRVTFDVEIQKMPVRCGDGGVIHFAMRSVGVSLESYPPINFCLILKSASGQTATFITQDSLVPYIFIEDTVGSVVKIWGIWVYSSAVDQKPYFQINSFETVSTPEGALERARGKSPTGKNEFELIDVKEQRKAWLSLNENNDSYLKKVLKNPEKYNPLVLYTLSDILFRKGRKDEAAFWYFVAELRGLSDASKALDESAPFVVVDLSQTCGPQIYDYVGNDYKKVKDIIEKASVWDKETSRKYDPKWVSLYGTDAYYRNIVAFEPKEKWETINQHTRNNYLETFEQAYGKYINEKK